MSDGFFNLTEHRKGTAFDVVYTPDKIAREIVNHFKPRGKILDPCKGGGAFLRYMPGADWCEIEEDRDFFEWDRPVDWIISNPPYSIIIPFTKHAMKVASDIVFLLPSTKFYGSKKAARLMTTETHRLREIFFIGYGRDIAFKYVKVKNDVGFLFATFHLSTTQGPCKISWMEEKYLK